MITSIVPVLCIIGLVASGTAVIYRNIALAKNEVTYRNRIIILEAIQRYHAHLFKEGLFGQADLMVTHMDMEYYGDTLKRFWDWGYTRILPPEKFELIKPYIEHKEKRQ